MVLTAGPFLVQNTTPPAFRLIEGSGGGAAALPPVSASASPLGSAASQQATSMYADVRNVCYDYVVGTVPPASNYYAKMCIQGTKYCVDSPNFEVKEMSGGLTVTEPKSGVRLHQHGQVSHPPCFCCCFFFFWWGFFWLGNKIEDTDGGALQGRSLPPGLRTLRSIQCVLTRCVYADNSFVIPL